MPLEFYDQDSFIGLQGVTYTVTCTGFDYIVTPGVLQGIGN